jgi:Flp pilus assembly protein TadB
MWLQRKKWSNTEGVNACKPTRDGSRLKGHGWLWCYFCGVVVLVVLVVLVESVLVLVLVLVLMAVVVVVVDVIIKGALALFIRV